ncbi:hypothetical protein KCP70_01330 [Salmonella enterica subsp. enterica]|nr:hypothetical protein KCP70_01330 [Salmonella enterica subsp. enterica]
MKREWATKKINSFQNKAALDNTPGVEDLTLPPCWTGDGGMKIFEYCRLASHRFSRPKATNPTETIINK